MCCVVKMNEGVREKNKPGQCVACSVREICFLRRHMATPAGAPILLL